MNFLYTFALWLLLPYVFLRLIWRSLKQPEYLQHVAERFGIYPPFNIKPVIWLHAVSVGETRATHSLVRQLQAIYPNHLILLSHTTPTGRAASEQLYGESVMRVYLPYDYPFSVNRFLRHFRPQLGILMETEIWFNLISACHKTHTPLLLLNARMSERSTQAYARFAGITRNSLGKLTAVAAQTADDALRLTNLGAKSVFVMGNLKFDIEPPSSMIKLGKQFRDQFGINRKILLAASTREGEEALLLDALQGTDIPDLLFVIVPRHPQRFNDVANLLDQRRIIFRRKSEMSHTNNGRVGSLIYPSIPSEIRVVLGDSMGELFAYYVAADLAFIGGSLLPYGGQNLIESCAVGTPVLVGPHMYNFEEATRLALSVGAAIQVPDAATVVTESQRLLHDTVTLHEMHRQCTNFVQSNRGATEKSVQLVKQYLQ